MENRRELIAQLDDVFRSRSIAIVGLPRGMKMGKLFLKALLDVGFPGDIYPVHPQADQIDGFSAYCRSGVPSFESAGRAWPYTFGYSNSRSGNGSCQPAEVSCKANLEGRERDHNNWNLWE